MDKHVSWQGRLIGCVKKRAYSIAIDQNQYNGVNNYRNIQVPCLMKHLNLARKWQQRFDPPSFHSPSHHHYIISTQLFLFTFCCSLCKNEEVKVSLAAGGWGGKKNRLLIRDGKPCCYFWPRGSLC